MKMNKTWLKLAYLFGLCLILAACSKNEDQAKVEVWLPDTKVVKLPMEEYAGIPFNTTREEAKEKFNFHRISFQPQKAETVSFWDH